MAFLKDGKLGYKVWETYYIKISNLFHARK